jgi:hypothetical protein
LTKPGFNLEALNGKSGHLFGSVVIGGAFTILSSVHLGAAARLGLVVG